MHRTILVYTSSNKNRKILGIWFIPVVLIPLIWPFNAILIGDFNLWLNDVVWHTERETTSDSPVGTTLLNSLKYLFQIEPVLLILGISGIIFAEIKRDFVILLWHTFFKIVDPTELQPDLVNQTQNVIVTNDNNSKKN